MASLNYKNEDGSWKKVAGGKTGVLTFNGRAGVVTPKEGDYTAEMVGAISVDDKAVSNGVATLDEDGKLLDAQIPSLAKLGAAPAGYGLGGRQIGGTNGYTQLNRSEIDAFLSTGIYLFVDVENPIYVDSIQNSGREGLLIHFQQNLNSTAAAKQFFIPRHAVQVGATANYHSFSMLVRNRRNGDASATWDEWEWENPPMILGYEYRTTERYNGKPVYVKLVNFGALPNATTKSVTWGDSTTQAHQVVGRTITGDQTFTLPIMNEATIWVNGSVVSVNTTKNYSNWTAYALIKYTKTTD